MRLSKSRFLTGLQCHRQLWWCVHEPDAPELAPTPDQQTHFDQGHVVGAAARERFPGGVLVEVPHEDLEGRVAATREALASAPSAIFEAAFWADDVFVAVDVLERAGTAHRLIEVKSSTGPKPEHVPDAAIQTHVLRCSGLEIERVELMHVNRECRHPRLEDLFVRADLTEKIERVLPLMPGMAREQLAMLQGPLPDMEPGEHCEVPYACPFKGRCWAALPRDHVRTLYNVGRPAWALAAQGYGTVHNLPPDFQLHPAAVRQRRALELGGPIIEPDLAAALDAIRPPFGVLDFETVCPAIPAWEGCRPYDQIPAQYSLHVVTAEGGVSHVEWVPERPGDPREEIAERLVAACAGVPLILAYYAPFEISCLRYLAESVPRLATELEDIVARTQDAYLLVRDHVYHPDFRADFGLKSVLPVLVPDLGYADLEVQGGAQASRELGRLLVGGDALRGEERDRLREALRRYCERDTFAVVKLLERLRELATPGGAVAP